VSDHHSTANQSKELAMSRADIDRDIEETLGIVPTFFKEVPDFYIGTEWESFKTLILSDQTAIPNKYKELIGLGVSGATRCRYCAYFHTEAARLFGATDEEINEASLVAKNTMGWSTYPQRAAIRLRRVRPRVRPDRGTRALPDGGARHGVTRLRRGAGGQAGCSSLPPRVRASAASKPARTDSSADRARSVGPWGSLSISDSDIRAPAKRTDSS